MIAIKHATLRDASWITAHLNPTDHAEAHCQLPDDTHNAVLAEWLIRGGKAFIAYERGEPILLFGTTPQTVCCMAVWAIGTERSYRAISAVSRYLIDVHIPDRLTEGFTSMEARALATHGAAHRWMESMGGEKHGPAFLYGKGGEFFVLYRWTVAAYRAIGEGRWSKR